MADNKPTKQVEATKAESKTEPIMVPLETVKLRERVMLDTIQELTNQLGSSIQGLDAARTTAIVSRAEALKRFQAELNKHQLPANGVHTDG